MTKDDANKQLQADAGNLGHLHLVGVERELQLGEQADTQQHEGPKESPMAFFRDFASI